jgi:hypothetical protein
MNIKIEGDTFCSHCGELIKRYDDVTIRDGVIYHDECLPENCH